MIAVVMVALAVFTGLGEQQVMAAINNTVTIHYKSAWDGANIFYWNQGDEYNNPVRWPGISMKEEGDEWYTYTFENTNTVDFMFNYEGMQSTHYTKTSGEYWVVNNQWYNHKPVEEEIIPTSTPKPTNTPKPTKALEVTKAPTKIPVVTEGAQQLLPTRAVTPTAAPIVTIAATDKTITLHFKSANVARLYYWNVNSGTNTPVAWPGMAMEDEGNGWYTYTIESVDSANVVFTTANGETEEMYVLDGEWWYSNELCDFAPDDYTAKPEVTKEAEIPVPVVSEAPTSTPTITEKPEATAVPTAAITEKPVATATPVPTQGPTATPKPAVKGKIIVHLSTKWSNPTIYYWKVNGAGEAAYAWPGTAMEDEGNGWYTYTIENATSSSLIFSDKGNSQTADLSQKEGEWWYKGSKWYTENPDLITPTPKPTKAPTSTPTPKPTRDPNATPTPTIPPVDRTDFRDETIYFVMTTRFYDGDPSNNVHCWDDAKAGNPDDDPAWRGDFKGLIEQLDYIKALGFTAIWITPVVENTSGYDYHGYHASDFSKVDSRYESADCTYQDLINACHEKGMKIIQDVVFNHTGNFGEANLMPMFTKEGDQSTADCLVIKEDSDLPENYNELTPAKQYDARLALMKNTDGENHDSENLYHHYGNFNWDEYDSQLAQIAGDCVDLNTENPTVYNYLIDCYTKYIEMGVDGFRVDTTKHISRLTFNETFNKAFKEAGGEDFFMFGEVCARANDVWYRNTPALSTPFYTWAETKDYGWSEDPADALKNVELTEQHFNDNREISDQPTSDNALLRGNEYHEPDYSQFSGLSVIDFPMHWNFRYATNAFNTAVGGDQYYNDATWNVTYVDSHDYAPDHAPENQRFSGDQETWAENLNVMFTFRGIPCIYYGSEIEFMKGSPIDVGPNAPLSTTGRAYLGDYLKGELTTTDFGEYTASGTVADTLNHPLSLHIQRLNKIRAAIPALRKGQYSKEGVSGDMAFKRRYTSDEEGVDSFVCVAITDGATFTGIPNGHYVEAITGDEVTVTGGTLSIPATGKGNMRVYVLDTELTKAPGQVGVAGKYLK